MRTEMSGPAQYQPTRSRRMYLIFKHNLHYILSPLLLLALIWWWDWAIVAYNITPILMPPPSKVFTVFWLEITHARFMTHLGSTLYSVALGFGYGSVTAVAMGTIFAMLPLVDRSIAPFIFALQTFPKIAIAPLLITWFGFGMAPKIIIAAILAFFPVLVNTVAGMKSVEPDLIDLMRSLRASRWQIFRLVQLPVALPFIFAGLNVAIVLAILGAITGEFVGSRAGIGYLITQKNAMLAIDAVFAMLIVLAILGISSNLLLKFLQKKIIFWQPTDKK